MLGIIICLWLNFLHITRTFICYIIISLRTPSNFFIFFYKSSIGSCIINVSIYGHRTPHRAFESLLKYMYLGLEEIQYHYCYRSKKSIMRIMMAVDPLFQILSSNKNRLHQPKNKSTWGCLSPPPPSPGVERSVAEGLILHTNLFFNTNQ